MVRRHLTAYSPAPIGVASAPPGSQRWGLVSARTAHSREEKRLVPLGYGVSGRTLGSRLSGDPIVCSQNGFLSAARQALMKLGMVWSLPKPNTITMTDV
jgi:hypothetical protein